MDNSKKTRKALLASIMALALCFVMLIGTTFAWFTDTATTGVNKIQAGNLEIDLQKFDATEQEWVSVKGETIDFVKAEGHTDEAILWEPGCTYNLPKLRVVNNGNLALKYKVVITGINGDAELNNAIDWIMNLDGVTADLSAEHKLLPGTAEDPSYDTFTISGHMKETAGNEYQGLLIEGISITVFATQDKVECDSNGNQYDASASYSNTVPAGGALTLTANGCTVVCSGMEEGKTYILIANKVSGHHANTEYTSIDQEIASYDIKVVDIDTNDVAESGNYRVTVKLDSGLQNVKAYHNGTIIPGLVYNSETGEATFTTNSFSKFDFTWDKKEVTVTPEIASTYKGYRNNVEYHFDGSFANDVVITLPANATIKLDGVNATFEKSVLIEAGSHQYYNAAQLITDKKGVYRISNFKAKDGVIAIGAKAKSVELSESTMKQLYVNGVDVELNIHNNTINSNETSNSFSDFLKTNYGKSYNAETDYAVMMDVAKYTLKFDNNKVGNNLGYAFGINGLQSSGIALGNEANNIKSFSGNTFENWYRGSKSSRRAAFKMWDDVTYADNSHQNEMSDAGEELVKKIKLSSNIFTHPTNDGKTYNLFCLYSVYSD